MLMTVTGRCVRGTMHVAVLLTAQQARTTNDEEPIALSKRSSQRAEAYEAEQKPSSWRRRQCHCAPVRHD